MGVPGSNLLEEAFSCIETVPVQYYQNAGRTLNDVGVWVSALSDPLTFQASVQAVDRRSYIELGLDFNKRYHMIYMSVGAQDFTRGTAGDEVQFNGRQMQIQSNLDWFEIDGWVGLLGVEIQP